MVLFFVLLFYSKNGAGTRLRITFSLLVSLVSLAILIVEACFQFRDTCNGIKTIG